MTREILLLGEEGERIELCAGEKISQVALLQERQVYNLFRDLWNGFFVWGVRGCGSGVVEQRHLFSSRFHIVESVTNKQHFPFLTSQLFKKSGLDLNCILLYLEIIK